MTIHDMLRSAATDLTAMEIKMRTLESQIEAAERDNERLRKAYAEAEIKRVNAETDLVHYQNLFVANVCKEAIDICKDMFEITHKNMRDRAEAAVQRMVEEKLEKEREESAAKPASDIDEEVEKYIDDTFQKTSGSVPATSTPAPQDGAIVQAPFELGSNHIKRYYRERIGFVPSNYMQKPAYQYSTSEDRWLQTPPSFLSNREPKVETRGGVSRAVLAVFGG